MQIITVEAVNMEIRLPWCEGTDKARWPLITCLERYDPNVDDIGEHDEVRIVAKGLTPMQVEDAKRAIQQIAREYGLNL